MTEDKNGRAASSDEPELVLRSATFEEWPSHMAVARMNLSTQRTVLVGRNGAGKSLLIDGLYSAARASIGPTPRTVPSMFEAPGAFTLDFSLAGEQSLISFASKWALVHGQSPDADVLSKPLSRTERCWIKQTGETLWSVEREVATLSAEHTIPVPPGLGLLSFNNLGTASGTDRLGMTKKLRTFMRGVRRIDAGLPRPGAKDFEIVQRQDNRRAGALAAHGKRPSRVGRLARRLVDAFEHRSETFREFAELAKQLSLAEEVTVKSFSEESAASGVKLLEGFWAVAFDRVNIGQLSDGTLRVAEILWTLVSLERSEMLLIEEPETGIHPGLLKKLLSVIESYSTGHQIVVSTHSTQVVNWAAAEEIRLVSREGETVSARSLRGDQLERVGRYLQDEGSLADFLFSGGVDD